MPERGDTAEDGAIYVDGGPWKDIPKGSIIYGVGPNKTETRWRIVRDAGLKKVRD